MRSLSLLVLFLLASGAVAEGGKPLLKAPSKVAVRDSLGLFSKEAIAAASREIAIVRERYKIDLFLETTDQMPDPTSFEKTAWIKSLAQKDAREDWAMKRADSLGDEGIQIDGVYAVVIDAGPGKRDVRVVPWPAGRTVDISPEKRKALRKILLELLGEPDEGKRDQILRRSWEWFQARAKEIRDPNPSPLSGRQSYLVCLCLAGCWIGLLVVRWRYNANVKPGDPEPVDIYQPAMMGTLFGVPAAFWVNDELFRVIPPEVTPVKVTPSDNFSMPMEPAGSDRVSEKASGA